MASYYIDHFEQDEGGGIFDRTVSSNIPTGNGTISNPWIVEPGDDISFTCNFGSNGDSVFNMNFGIWGVTSLTLSLFSPPSATVASGSDLTDAINWQTETYYVRRESVVADPNPDQFTFNDITDVALFTFYNSNIVTLSGMNTTATASVTNGFMSQNGGAFTDQDVIASNGDTFQLRHRSNSAYSATKTTTLTIGTTSESFISTTIPEPDPNPDQFTFNDITDVELFTFYNSNTITLSGMNTTATASVTNGFMSQNGGAFTDQDVTASNGDTFQLRHRSNSAYSATKTTTLTIGTTSESFISTTIAEPDPNPDQFNFNDVSGVALSSINFSNEITLSGMDTQATATVSGGLMSRNGEAYTSDPRTANNGDTFRLRKQASGSFSTTVQATLTVGTTSDTWFVTTLDADSTPDQFSLGADINNVELDSLHYRQFTVTGINTSVTVTASGTGCQISATDATAGPWTTELTGITNNTVIYCRFRSSGANYSTTRVMTVTIGTVSDSINVTTRAIDDDPDAFSLGPNQSALGRNITVPLQSFTISGMDSGATISVTGSGTASTEVSKNNVDFFTSLTGITNGDTIYSRGTTSGSYSTSTTATVTANGVSDSVVLTTESNPTAGNNEIPFPITSGNPISIDDIASFFAGTSVGRPDNLGAFYRGGTYVPNITTNTNIPTSGAISMGDFYGSATEFTFVMINSNKADAITEGGSGSTTLTVLWGTGDWDVGPGGALDIGTEYRYSNFTIDYREGQTVDPVVLQGTQTFSASNTTFSVVANVQGNLEYFCYGTLTIEARPPSSPATVVARTVNWTFTVISLQ